MTIIDGFPLAFSPGGIRSYLLSFVNALNDEKINETNKEFILLIPKLDLVPLNESMMGEISRKKIKIRLVDLNKKTAFLRFLGGKTDTKRRFVLFLWSHYFLPKEVKKLNPDVVFHPYQIASDYKSTAKKVVVIHDVFHWTHFERYSKIEKYFYDSFKKGCRNADVILTVSETSKVEISRYLEIEPERINVCYEGINTIFEKVKANEAEKEQVMQKYSISSPYIFGFVSARSYKNTLGTVKVFHQLLKSGQDLKLVLLGGNINTNKYVKEYIEANNLSDYIRFVSKIDSDKELYYIYNQSEVFIFLSFEEGFGLPPLEAIASQTMPIVSNLSSMEEIYSEHLPTFNPDAYKEIADFILNLDEKKKTELLEIARKNLIKKYSWETVLENYLRFI